MTKITPKKAKKMNKMNFKKIINNKMNKIAVNNNNNKKQQKKMKIYKAKTSMSKINKTMKTTNNLMSKKAPNNLKHNILKNKF